MGVYHVKEEDLTSEICFSLSETLHYEVPGHFHQSCGNLCICSALNGFQVYV